MEQKKLVMLGMVVGSSVGGFVPALWDASMFSVSGIVFAALGGFLGIYLGFKLGE